MNPEQRKACVSCGEPVHPDDPKRHGYGGVSHIEYRCVELLRYRLEAADARIKQLEEAVETIADPILFLSKEADKVGASLDGRAAISIASDPAWMNSVAKAALCRAGKEGT
jgi:hypothetical protein